MPEKDGRIIALLERLRQRIGSDTFEVVDHWESDLCAVGIASPRNHGVLAYLSIFGCPLDRYDVDLELPPEPNSDFPYRDGGRFRNLDFETLARTVKAHFDSRE